MYRTCHPWRSPGEIFFSFSSFSASSSLSCMRGGDVRRESFIFPESRLFSSRPRLHEAAIQECAATFALETPHPKSRSSPRSDHQKPFGRRGFRLTARQETTEDVPQEGHLRELEGDERRSRKCCRRFPNNKTSRQSVITNFFF